MPNPVKVNSTFKPHRLLLSRPDHAARIAAIAAQWTEVEEYLSRLLGSTFGSSTKDERGSHSINMNWVAKTAIRDVETIRLRLKIIDNTLGAILRERAPELAQEWDSLHKSLNLRGRERNKIIHGSWSLSNEFPSDLLPQDIQGKMYVYTVRDFDEILDRIVLTWQLCNSFEMKILEYKLHNQFPGSTV